MKTKVGNLFSSRSLLYFANAYILLSIGFYWIGTTLLNPFAIGLLVIFSLHLFLAKGGSKLIFPIIFAIVNLYMFLALYSEFREFPSMTKEAMIMITIGTLYLGLNLTCAIVMMKNANNSDQFKLELS